MLNKIITKDNFVFVLSALLSSVLCYVLLGSNNITLGIISVLFTFILYSAKPENNDHAYIFMWLGFILAACYLGIFLKLSFGFYLFLFIVSNYYYISYTKDPYSDRAIPYMVIYASLGTTINELDYESAISYFIGSIVTLLVLRVLHKQKIKFTAFKTGLFSKGTYKDHPRHLLYSSLIYSFLLFLCLYLPDCFGLQRPYWAPMAFVMLLKPQGDATVSNTIKRFEGSVLGGLVVILLQNFEGYHPVLNFIFIAILAFFIPSFFKMNYLLKTFGTTVFILLLLETTIFLKDPNYSLPYMRIVETFIGGSLAILGSYLNSRITLLDIRKPE